MRSSSFNILHLAIAVLVVIVLVALMYPLLASHKRGHDAHWRSSQLRGIHQGLVTFANSNKNAFPGLDPNGGYARYQTPTNGSPGNAGDPYANLRKQVGIDVEDRYAILLGGEFITPEYAVSPSETDPAIQPWPEAGPVTREHYSYAMLQVPTQGGRHGEWRQTVNSQSIIMSDRNTGTTKATGSIHADDGEPWRGQILWNDNHVAFENGPVFETKFGNRVFPKDHLFQAQSDDDAYLIHAGN